MTKQELELLSNKQIRRGFEKYILKTLEYFNFVEITKDEAIKIVDFINKSNSRIFESYWILRTELKKEEWIILLNEYKDNFINSSYKNTNRRKVSKQINGNNACRGYTGYTELNNKQFYCRSQHEFIYIHYLHLIYNTDVYKIEMEEKIFYIDNLSYKPDVFIYDINNNLIKIYEVKDKQLNEEESKKYNLFGNYFKSINIDYEIVYSGKEILKQYPEIKIKLEDWKMNRAKINIDNKGIHNPRYGMHCTDETKKLISQKAKERFENIEYKEQQRQKTIIAMKNPDVRKKISNKKKIKDEERRLLKNSQDPIIIKKCVICNTEFKCRTSNINKLTCSGGCTLKYNISIGKTTLKIHDKKLYYLIFKNKILRYCDLIFLTHIETFDEFEIKVKQLKKENKIPKSFGMTINTINKYFNDFNNLKIQYENYKNNKTIS